MAVVAVTFNAPAVAVSANVTLAALKVLVGDVKPAAMLMSPPGASTEIVVACTEAAILTLEALVIEKALSAVTELRIATVAA